MAIDYSIYKPSIGQTDYLTKYENFVNEMEDRANEIETAREGEADLITNLQNNYAKYNLTSFLNGGALLGTATGGTATVLQDSGGGLSALSVGEKIVNVTETTNDIGVGDNVFYGIISNIDSDTQVTLTNVGVPVASQVVDWLNGDDYCAGGYRATNMPDPINLQDYATRNYLLGLSSSLPSNIEGLDPGSLNANDTLIVNSTGTAITGRPNRFYTTNHPTTPTTIPLTTSITAAIYDNIPFDVSGGSISITLPSGSIGAPINFSDLYGTLDATHTVTIVPAAGEKIMGQNADDTLLLNEFVHMSFELRYISTAFGWCIFNFQR